MATNKDRKNTLRVVELFAGVGGFRIGLDQASKKTGPKFETVWANQWEPATGTKQHAAWVYEQAFFRSKGINDEKVIRQQLSNEDINKVVNDPVLMKQIPDHDVLVGGFPCQDYSVARPLNQAKGLEGKKGVLWWSIYKILQQKKQNKKPVQYVFLENVDRLLKSPASRRGRDFAIILSCLNELGYIVEWRVVNAGEYGFPQRRRRTFILGYYKGSAIHDQFSRNKDASEWISSTGVLATAFPATVEDGTSGSFSIHDDAVEITKNFVPLLKVGEVDETSPFQNSGMMVGGRVTTQKTRPRFTGRLTTLNDIIAATKEKDIDELFYIPRSAEQKWKEQKGSHEFDRVSKEGHKYHYTEGALPFPDKLDRPSRTIITSEGGQTPTRFKHVVALETPKQVNGKTCRYRRLTPEELESLCMFPRCHTKQMYVPTTNSVAAVPDTRRAFFMGNALVVGVIKSIGREILARQITDSPELVGPSKQHAKETAEAHAPR